MSTTLSKPETTANKATTTVNYRRPVYQVHNLEDAYEVQVQVPGCSKEGIQIDHEKDVLTIQATRKEAVNADWKLLHREIRDADYQLKLSLNVDINADKISAKTEDGVLKIHLPISEQAKPRQIAVE